MVPIKLSSIRRYFEMFDKEIERTHARNNVVKANGKKTLIDFTTRFGWRLPKNVIVKELEAMYEDNVITKVEYDKYMEVITDLGDLEVAQQLIIQKGRFKLDLTR